MAAIPWQHLESDALEGEDWRARLVLVKKRAMAVIAKAEGGS